MRIPTNSFFMQEMNSLTKQYSKMARLTTQSETQKKLLFPSDDPVLANRIQLTSDYLNQLQAYQQNQVLAKNRTDLYETSITNGITYIEKMKGLIQNAANGTLNDENRVAIATEIEGYLPSLLNIANSKDGQGQYIYAGYNSNSPAYVQQGNSYQYQGSSESGNINISNSNTILYSQSGKDIFGNVNLGNGDFTISLGSNTGTAFTDAGSVVNRGEYISDTYTLSFVTNSSGKMGYQVIGANSGQIIPPLPNTLPANAPEFVTNKDITFNGLSFHITGDPQIGDTLTIAPSSKQNIFDTIQSLITTLRTPISGDPTNLAKFQQSISQSSASFEQIFEVFQEFRTSIGTRQSNINMETETTQNLIHEQTAVLSSLADVEEVQIITDIKKQVLSLQVLQDSYSEIQKSIFQFFNL